MWTGTRCTGPLRKHSGPLISPRTGSGSPRRWATKSPCCAGSSRPMSPGFWEGCDETCPGFNCPLPAAASLTATRSTWPNAVPASFVNIDDTDPAGAEGAAEAAVPGLRHRPAWSMPGRRSSSSAAGPEGRWCPHCPCNTIYHSWTKTCPSCGGETVPESEMARDTASRPVRALRAVRALTA